MQFQVTNSPFNQEQTELLNHLFSTLTEEQKIWLGGYLAASQVTGASNVAPKEGQNTLEVQEASEDQNQVISREVTVLYGSETGNAQALAEEVRDKLKERNFTVKTSSMDDFKPKALKKVEDLLVVTATHGEGDPPDNAVSFFEFLNSRKAPKLDGTRFSVLSLGDESYEFFCQTGKDIDNRLEELGGERLYTRVDCDVDFDDPAAEWINGVLSVLNESNSSANASAGVSEAALQSEQPAYSRTNPFNAEILENLKLNGRGSNKETRHLELSLEGSNMVFEPGDSLGIFPKNEPWLVDRIIENMDWNPEEPVPVSKQDTRPLREALISHYEISRLTKPLVEKAVQFSSNSGLKDLLENGNEEKLKAYINGRDLLDLLQDFFPWEAAASDFIKILRKLPARLYSIASSYKANPDEVHLTIGTVRYESHGRGRTGVCSGQCAERAEPGDLLPIYIHRNPNFKFPENPDTPVIMIGPGTGVAPFRSYLEEREEIGATGKTWLFFGEQHFSTDFLYQVDWQNWLKEDVLSKLDVAFSRDTDEKVYVQNRMLEKSRDLFQWLEDGASVYVCGDEKNMASDVHETILTILKQEGGLSQEAAESYLSDLKQQKRYQRDVY